MADTNNLLQEILKALKSDRKGPRGTGSGVADAMSAGLSPAQVEKMIDDLAAANAEHSNLNAQAKELAQLMAETNSYIDRRIGQAQLEITATRKVLEDREEALRLAVEAMAIKDKEIETAKAAEGFDIRKLKALQDQRMALMPIVAARQNEVEEADEILKKQNASLDVTSSLLEKTENMLNVATLSSRGWDDSFFGKLQKSGGGVKSLASSIGDVGKTVGSAIHPMNVVGSLATNIVSETGRMVFAQDQALASFNRATGAGGRYNEVITNVRSETFEMGVDIAAAAQAMQGLVMTFSKFASLSEQAQQQMGELAVTMEALGVNAQDTGEFFESMVQGLGMSVEQASGELRKAAGAANALGVPMSSFMNQMRQAMPELAAFGDEATKQFGRLAAAAKASGIEANRLMDIIGKFDTFDSAATMVSNLNAMMGTNLNMMELMEAQTKGPLDAIMVLKQGFDESGQSFNDMNFYMKKSVAKQLGVSVQELGQLMNMSASEIQGYANDAENAALTQQEMAEMAKKAAPAMAKFTAVFQQLAIAVKPLIDALHFVAEGLAIFTDALGAFAAPAIFAAGVLMAGLGKSIMKFANIGVDKIAAKLTGKFVPAVSATGPAAAGSVKPMLAFGAAMMMVGAGIALVFLSLGPLVDSLSELTGVGLLGLATVFIALGVGIYFLLPALHLFAVTAGVSAKPVMAFGFAILLIGAGIALMGLGIMLAAKGFAELGDNALTAGLAIALIVGSIALLAFALGGLSTATPFAIGAFIALAAGILALAFALVLVPMQEFDYLTRSLEAIANINPTSLTGISTAMGSIVTAADKLDEDKIENLSKLFATLTFGTLFMGASLKPVTDFFTTLNGVKSDAIIQVASAIGKLAESFGKLEGVLGGITGMFTGMSIGIVFEELKELGEVGPGATSTLIATKELFEATAKLDADAAENAGKIIDKTKELAEELAGFGSGAELQGILSQLVSAVTGKQGKDGKPQSQPIVLSMNRDGAQVMAKGLIDPLWPLINQKMDSRN